jgi:hypothetical protein
LDGRDDGKSEGTAFCERRGRENETVSTEIEGRKKGKGGKKGTPLMPVRTASIPDICERYLSTTSGTCLVGLLVCMCESIGREEVGFGGCGGVDGREEGGRGEEKAGVEGLFGVCGRRIRLRRVPRREKEADEPLNSTAPTVEAIRLKTSLVS